ncbi:MAG: hypothetical protein WAU78_10995, partial [Roseiarcus sp.]
MTTTQIAETDEAGETTELNFSVAFDYASLASLNAQYGAYETVTWSASLGPDVTGVVTMSPTSGSGTLSATGPVVDISVAPNAVTGDTFSINATETLNELGVAVTDNFSFNYTIVPGPNSPGEIPGIPDVPAGAQMEQVSPGTVQSGDYHVNADGSWDVDNRTAGADDDQSYYNGTNITSLLSSMASVVVQGVATQVSSALQSAGQSAANVLTDFTALSNNPLIPTFKTFFQNISNDAVSAIDTIAQSDLSDPTNAELLQTGEQLAAQIVPDSSTFLKDAQQNFEDTGQSLPAQVLQLLRTETDFTTDGSFDYELGDSVSVSFVDPGTTIDTGTEAGIIIGGAGDNTIELSGGQHYVYTNGGDDTIDMAGTGSSAFVDGGGDTIDFSGGSGDAASLFSTGGSWDWVSGASALVYLDSAQAAVTGGGDGIVFAGGSGNAAGLYSTGGSWDTVSGSNGTVYLTSAQTAVYGGGDWINFAGGTGNAASLYSTGGSWDGVIGSNGTVYLESAQTAVYGGGDWIDFA